MTLLSEREQADLAEILRLHDVALRDYLERHNDGHKSSEGCVELLFRNFWDRDGWDKPGAPGKVGVSIYSYALGPNRTHFFDTIAECLTAVRGWHDAQLSRGVDE